MAFPLDPWSLLLSWCLKLSVGNPDPHLPLLQPLFNFLILCASSLSPPIPDPSPLFSSPHPLSNFTFETTGFSLVLLPLYTVVQTHSLMQARKSPKDWLGNITSPASHCLSCNRVPLSYPDWPWTRVSSIWAFEQLVINVCSSRSALMVFYYRCLMPELCSKWHTFSPMEEDLLLFPKVSSQFRENSDPSTVSDIT